MICSLVRGRGLPGRGDSPFSGPSAVALSPGPNAQGLIALVADRFNDRVCAFGLRAGGAMPMAPAWPRNPDGSPTRWDEPSGVAVDAPPAEKKQQKEKEKKMGKEEDDDVDEDVDVEEGLVYVAEGGAHRVRALTRAGAVRSVLGGRGRLRNPAGVCVGPGPRGRVFVADRDNHRVLVFLKPRAQRSTSPPRSSSAMSAAAGGAPEE